MSALVFGAVIFSAFFQAGWNFLTKKSRADKVALLAVGWFIMGAASLPLVFAFVPLSEWRDSWWNFVLISGTIHALYFLLLGWGYSLGEISVVYPVSRGLGVVGTTVIATNLEFGTVSTIGGLGIVSVTLGTLLIGFRELPRRQARSAFLVSILIALTVAGYSIVDSQAARVVPTIPYMLLMFFVAPLIASPLLVWRLRPAIASVVRMHKIEALGVAFAGAFAYGIILWAFKNSQVHYVAALREFSVVIAATLGVVFLGEPLYARKAFGIGAILVGVILIKLA